MRLRRPIMCWPRPNWLVVLVTIGVWVSLGTHLRAADLAELTVLFRTGKYAECADLAATAISQNEFHETYRLLKIQSEMTLGRYSAALETLNAGVAKLPTSIQLRWIGRDVCRMNGKPERVGPLEQEINELVGKAPWRYSDPSNQVLVGRFLLQQGTDPKRVLDEVYNLVKKRQPNSVDAYVASGDLALEKHDYGLAAQAFEQALQRDAVNPEVQLGLARSFAPSHPDRAEAALRAALELNSNHIPSLLLLVDQHIDAERYELAERVLQRVAGVNPQHPQASAYRAVLAHLANQPDQEKQHREAALRPWPANPEVDFLIGLKLSQKYRFAEGERYQRQALANDPKYLPARLQLSQDLLRLGKEEEGWRLADEVSREDGYDVVAHNLLTLQENLARFQTLERDGFIVRMEAREAEIYGSRVLDLLQRARTELGARYDVQLEQPVLVELFPRQEDFAIRTFGLPGGAGFLGVCFGTVITANSPASQSENPASWEATLWHEFCHVITLSKTRNKMPRWLSEGISVYEERRADPTWGETLRPAYRAMLLGDELTPVSELSAAFLRPESPLQLQFAYFESSLVVEYLVEKYGLPVLQKILVDLGAGLPINESLARYAGSLDGLNAEFTEYARRRAAAMAPDADWSAPEFAQRADRATIVDWLKMHPNNYRGMQQYAQLLLRENDHEAALGILRAMTQLYPGDGGDDGCWVLLATVYRKTGDSQKERDAWEKVIGLRADHVGGLSRLGELAAVSEDWELARRVAHRWLAVQPLQPAPHRLAAEAAEALSDDALGIASYRALLQLDPLDPAELHYRLAGLLARAGGLRDAKRHILWALEETPRYRAAHRRLLEIERLQQAAVSPPKSASTGAEVPPAASTPGSSDSPDSRKGQ